MDNAYLSGVLRDGRRWDLLWGMVSGNLAPAPPEGSALPGFLLFVDDVRICALGPLYNPVTPDDELREAVHQLLHEK